MPCLQTCSNPTVPAAAEALPGRDTLYLAPRPHAVLGNPIIPPFPEGTAELIVGMGCFWGAERLYWQKPGVWTTPLSAMPAGIHRTPLIVRCVQAIPAILRWCRLSMTLM